MMRFLRKSTACCTNIIGLNLLRLLMPFSERSVWAVEKHARLMRAARRYEPESMSSGRWRFAASRIRKKSLNVLFRLMHFLWCPRRESNTRPTA